MNITVSGSYQSDKNKVRFISDGVSLAGLLYLPEGKGPFPATTIVRPASGVKEQTVGVYVKALASNGIAALAFDPKGYGESEGRPLVEDPFSVISDAENATSVFDHCAAGQYGRDILCRCLCRSRLRDHGSRRR